MENIENNYCENLLGLYFTEPEHHDCQYVHAFSFNKKLLELFIEEKIIPNEKKMYSIKPIKIYKYNRAIDNENFEELQLLTNYKFHDILQPIYGYNFIKDYIVEQVLLVSKIRCVNLEENGISYNPIEIDTFYEESILNA